MVTERTFTFPPGTTWVDGPTRRLFPCGGDSSSGDSSGQSSSGSSEGETCPQCVEVAGSIMPETALGEYTYVGLVNGRCSWAKAGTNWYIAWDPVSQRWGIKFLGDEDLWWFKPGGDVWGDYGPGPGVEGLAHVAPCGSSSGAGG